MDVNITVLDYILTNTDLLEHHNAAKGIAKKIIAEKTLKNLSQNQNNIYQSIIFPLLTPHCEGVMDDPDHNTCSGNGFVDEESLLLSYQEDRMLCQLCRYDKQRIQDE